MTHLLRWIGVLALGLTPALASAQVQLQLTNTSGVSPRIVGYNFHALDDLSDWGWVEHSGVNGARVWLGVDIQRALPGEAVSTSSEFVARRLALRDEIDAGPLGNGNAVSCNAQVNGSTASAYIDWAHYADEWAGPYTVTFDEMTRRGMSTVVQHTLGSSTPLIQDPASAAHWQKRWELWRHMFALAYFGAMHWNLTTYQIWNEPNLHIEAPDYVERLRLASDAIQLALKAVNKHRNRCGVFQTLKPTVLAPTTAGNPAIYGSGSEAWTNQPEAPLGNAFFCNPALTTTGCWGRYTLQNRVATTFYNTSLSAADSPATLFQGYSFHRYNSVTAGEQNLRDLWTYLRNFPGSPPAMPLYMTEHNRFQGSEWSATDTPDTTQRFLEFAQMLIRDARALPVPSSPLATIAKNIFIFKLQQSGDAKTGLHYIDLDGGKIGGATNMAEVLRLYTRAFTDQLVLWDVSSTDSAVQALGATDNRRDIGTQVMVVNTSTSTKSIDIGLPLGSTLDGFARIDTVTPARRGNAWIATKTNRHVAFSLPGQSVALVTAPDASNRLLDVQASADATVKGGTNRFTNYGTSSNLYAASNATSSGARNVSYIRFQVPSNVDWSTIKLATLKVFAQAKNTAGTVGTTAIAHVYGLEGDDTWTETGIKGSNAPNIAIVDGPMTRVAENFVTGAGVSAHFVGHLTGAATAESIGVDVTDFVKNHSGNSVTFMVVREVRFDPGPAVNNVEDSVESERSLWMTSREGSISANRPKLQLALSQ